MTTETLDQRIRAKAHRDLVAEIEEAAEPLARRFRIGYSITIDQLFNANTTCSTLLDAIKKRLVSELSEKRQEQAVGDFLARVNSFQEQLDDLRSSVEE